MLKPMTIHHRLCLASITCLVIISAATAGAMSIRFLPWDDQIAARKIGFSNGTDVAEIQDLHPDKRSKGFTWEGGEVPPAVVAMDRTSPDGKVVNEPLKLPAGIQAPLVLLLPDNTKPSGIRCFVIEDATGGFGWGNLRFLNATGKELLVRHENTVKKLPGTWKPVDFSPGGSRRNIGVQFAAPDDLTAILFSSVWEHDPDVRKLVIVVPGADASTGALDIKIIPENRRSVAQPTASSTP
jgi:hypothetical protein